MGVWRRGSDMNFLIFAFGGFGRSAYTLLDLGAFFIPSLFGLMVHVVVCLFLSGLCFVGGIFAWAA